MFGIELTIAVNVHTLREFARIWLAFYVTAAYFIVKKSNQIWAYTTESESVFKERWAN